MGTTIKVAAKTVFALYLDRWPVEQTPLAAKQRVGMQRQYVWKPECCWRLPELGMLAGNMLTHLAYELPPMPTGYWDRKPKKTPGRLQQALRKAGRPEFFQYDPRIRPKAAISAHLPKGIEGPRSKKTAEAVKFSEN